MDLSHVPAIHLVELSPERLRVSEWQQTQDFTVNLTTNIHVRLGCKEKRTQANLKLKLSSGILYI